jgi:hypothetical protein
MMIFTRTCTKNIIVTGKESISIVYMMLHVYDAPQASPTSLCEGPQYSQP